MGALAGDCGTNTVVIFSTFSFLIYNSEIYSGNVHFSVNDLYFLYFFIIVYLICKASLAEYSLVCYRYVSIFLVLLNAPGYL